MARKLYRSKTERMVAGVCSGIAQYFEIDPSIVRLIWAFLTVMSGFLPGVLIYLAAWIIVPEHIENRIS